MKQKSKTRKRKFTTATKKKPTVITVTGKNFHQESYGSKTLKLKKRVNGANIKGLSLRAAKDSEVLFTQQRSSYLS